MVGPCELGRQHDKTQNNRDQAGTWQNEHRDPGKDEDDPGNEDSRLPQWSGDVPPVLCEPSHARAAPSIAIASRRLIRSSTGGWVENNDLTPPAESGLTM